MRRSGVRPPSAPPTKPHQSNKLATHFQLGPIPHVANLLTETTTSNTKNRKGWQRMAKLPVGFAATNVSAFKT